MCLCRFGMHGARHTLRWACQRHRQHTVARICLCRRRCLKAGLGCFWFWLWGRFRLAFSFCLVTGSLTAVSISTCAFDFNAHMPITLRGRWNRKKGQRRRPSANSHTRGQCDHVTFCKPDLHQWWSCRAWVCCSPPIHMRFQILQSIRQGFKFTPNPQRDLVI